jgi:hypothetical protein
LCWLGSFLFFFLFSFFLFFPFLWSVFVSKYEGGFGSFSRVFYFPSLFCFFCGMCLSAK